MTITSQTTEWIYLGLARLPEPFTAEQLGVALAEDAAWTLFANPLDHSGERAMVAGFVVNHPQFFKDATVAAAQLVVDNTPGFDSRFPYRAHIALPEEVVGRPEAATQFIHRFFPRST